jgi:hypothetical protein
MLPLSAYLPSIISLGSILIIAGMITAARPYVRQEVRQRRSFMVIAAITIVAQAAHFLEELAFGFFIEFPAVFGLPPFTKTAFALFNVTWLVIWAVALFGVRVGVALATWPLWFLGLAAVLNMIAHPVLGLRAEGYFPGLFTAPVVGITGILLLRQLTELTSKEPAV